MIFEYVLFLIWSIVEFWNIFIIISQFSIYEQKKRSNINIFLSCLVGVLITSIVAYSAISGYRIFFVLSYTPFLIKSIFIINQLYVIKIKTYFMTIFFVVINSTVASNIGIMIKELGLEMVPMQNIMCEVIASFIFMVILQILLLLKTKKHIIVYFEELSYWDYLLFFIILYSLTLIELVVFDSSNHTNATKVITVVAFLSVSFLIFRTIVTLVHNVNLYDERVTIEKQFKLTSGYYNQLVEKEIHTKKFRHDIKNLLVVLHSMIMNNQNEEALNYIAELQEISNYGSVTYSSGNFIADAILTTKSADAVKNDIQIELEGLFPTDRISDVDMVIILSNILDNAIEASGRMSGKKEIQIKSILRKNNWVLIVKNPSLEVVIDGKNGIQTNKNDSNNHGIGLKNVINAVGKYDGELTLDYNDGKFTSMVKFQFSQG